MSGQLGRLSGEKYKLLETQHFHQGSRILET